MRLRICKRQRLCGFRNQAHESFADFQRGLVNGLTGQTFCRKQFKATVRPHHVDRADLRHHIRGDLDDDLVQTRLCIHRFRHSLAEPAHQQAGTARSCTRRGWQINRPGIREF